MHISTVLVIATTISTSRINMGGGGHWFTQIALSSCRVRLHAREEVIERMTSTAFVSCRYSVLITFIELGYLN